MQPINLIGGFYKDDALPWSVQDTVNLLPVAAEVDGTRTPTKLRTPPGLRPFVNIGDGPDYAIRGMHDVEGALFVVSGSRLYRISNTGVAIPCGTIPGVGRVSMAHNQITGGNELLVVNGDAGYVWNTVTETFARVSDEGYPGAFIADYIDSYLAQVEPFGRYWFHSDLADAMSYNTLDRAESEAAPDRIVSLLSAHLEVWVFGERTIEVFENVGAGTGTFQNKRVAIEHGCAGRFTPAKLDNGIFWLGNDGVVYRANGYQPQRISTHAIERAIADSDWSQAFAFTWSDRGHAVYYLTFPDGQTWGYDVSSGLWHRRATYHPQHDVARRWRLNDLVYSNRQWIGGDYRDGKLYALDWDYVLEGEGDPLVRERVAQVLHADQRRFSVNEVELVMETGGPETAPVMFAAQPIGPTLAGAAPDGVATVEYPGYMYTAVSGDAPIVSRELVSGTLPADLDFIESSLAITVATPQYGGNFPLTLRVVDANGLSATLDDVLNIEPAWEWMEDFGGDLYGVASDDAGVIVACGYVSSVGELWRNDLDAGAWLKIADIPSTPAQWRSIAWGKVNGVGYWVASFGQHVLTSTDAETWSISSGANPTAYLSTVYVGTGFIRLGFNGSAACATNPRDAWVSTSIGVASDVRSAVADRTRPGTAVAFLANGGIRRTTNGGQAWGGALFPDGPDPYPSIGFAERSSTFLDGEITAYKLLSPSSLAVYRTADGGATFKVETFSIESGIYAGGAIGAVAGKVRGEVAGVVQPDYVQIWSAEGNSPPLTRDPLKEGPGSPAPSVVHAIHDTGLGLGIALLRYSNGTSSSYRYRY